MLEDKSKMYVTSYSEEVTGNNTHVKVEWRDGRSVCFVVDCGLFQEKEHNHINEEKLPYNPENISFAIATHVHTDHVGRFPYLVRCGFNGKLYTSSETATLLPVVLAESKERLDNDLRKNLKEFKNIKTKIKEGKLAQKGRGKRDIPRHEKCRKKKHYKTPKHPEVLYEREHIDALIKNVEVKALYETFSPVQGLEITFYPNAHIAGAVLTVCRVFDDNEEYNILFTGDLALTNPTINTKTVFPEDVARKINAVICESTYGSSEVERQIEKERQEHMRIIKEAHKNNSTIVYMSNSLERPLRLGVDLKQMQEEDFIGKELSNYKIFFDSTFGIKCLKKYEKLYGTDYLPAGFTVVDRETRDVVLGYKGKKMLICTSPRFFQGSFINYADKLLEDPNAILIFVAYVPEEVRNIIELPAGSEIKYRGKQFTLRCKRHQFGYYSSHASTKDMDTFLCGLVNCKVFLFNHGTNDSKINYMKRYKSSKRTTHNLLFGRTVLLTSNGIEKYF